MSKAFDELVRIVKENNYCFNQQFKVELLAALKRKTGNNNIGILVEYIIDNERTIKKKGETA